MEIIGREGTCMTMAINLITLDYYNKGYKIIDILDTQKDVKEWRLNGTKIKEKKKSR